MSDYPNSSDPKISGEYSHGVAMFWVILLLAILIACLLGACGGGDPEPEPPPVDQRPPLCQARPEVCK